MTKNMMKFQNSIGFHHVPDQCCHFPPKPTDVFCHAFSKPCHIFPKAAIPFLFHHAFSKHFIMILPTLPFFTKADMVNSPPTTLFGNPFWFASPPLSPIIPGLGLYQRATKFSPEYCYLWNKVAITHLKHQRWNLWSKSWLRFILRVGKS